MVKPTACHCFCRGVPLPPVGKLRPEQVPALLQSHFCCLCLWRSQLSTLHCPFPGTSDPCSSWYGTVPGLSIWSTTPAGLADQLKILLLFLLILLSFLLKRVQSFPPTSAGPNVIIFIAYKHTNVHDFELWGCQDKLYLKQQLH